MSVTIQEKPNASWNCAYTFSSTFMPVRSGSPVVRSKYGFTISHVCRQHLAEARATGVLVCSSFSISSR